MNNRIDREVRENMRGWACAGLPIEHELLKAIGYLRAGELSDNTAQELKLVIGHTIYNGYEVLRDNGSKRDNSDFFSGAGHWEYSGSGRKIVFDHTTSGHAQNVDRFDVVDGDGKYHG